MQPRDTGSPAEAQEEIVERLVRERPARLGKQEFLLLFAFPDRTLGVRKVVRALHAMAHPIAFGQEDFVDGRVRGLLAVARPIKPYGLTGGRRDFYRALLPAFAHHQEITLVAVHA